MYRARLHPCSRGMPPSAAAFRRAAAASRTCPSYPQTASLRRPAGMSRSCGHTAPATRMHPCSQRPAHRLSTLVRCALNIQAVSAAVAVLTGAPVMRSVCEPASPRSYPSAACPNAVPRTCGACADGLASSSSPLHLPRSFVLCWQCTGESKPLERCCCTVDVLVAAKVPRGLQHANLLHQDLA